jgi:alcohol dehydrogenase, propanol-preferring
METQTMKAAQFYEVNSPLRIEEIPIPDIGPEEVLVQVQAVGLCGSDVHIVYEGVTPTAFKPITLGHEPAGIVARVGSAVEEWQPGTRVSVLPLLFCGVCPTCLRGQAEICEKRRMIGIQAEGALARYVRVPAKNLVRLPDNVPFAIGAIITDAVATPFHALIDRATLKSGESIAIFGVGGLGLHAVQIAKLAGARWIIAVDVRDEQLERARSAGADLTLNSKNSSPVTAIREATGGRGVDVAAEFIGRQETIAQAVEAIAAGGRVVVAGLGPDPITVLPPTIFVRKELTLLGSYAFTRQTIEQLLELVATGKLDLSNSITDTFPLEQVNEGLKVLHEKIGNPIRVVITP